MENDYTNKGLISKFFSKFSNQIILVFSVTTTIIMVITVALFYMSTTQIIKSEMINSNEVVLREVNKNFDDYVKGIQDFALNFTIDERAMSIFMSNDIGYLDEKYLYTQVKTMFYSRPDIYDVKLYLPKKRMSYSITRSKQQILKEYDIDVAEKPWFEKASKGKYYAYVEPRVNLEDTFEKKSSKTAFFTVYRTIINVYNQKPLGIVSITCDQSAFLNMIENVNDMEDGMVGLMDKNNSFYYVSSNNLLDTQTKAQLLDKLNHSVGITSNFPMTINGEKYLVVYNESQRNGWKMIKMISLNKINEGTIRSRNRSLTILIFAIVISIALIMVITKGLTSSLKKLSKQMSMAGKGDFKTRVDVKGSYEITSLARKYNSMITQIDDLIEKNYLAEISAKTAHLIALETQINPHFLYNALQVISAKAIVNKQSDIYRMIEALAFNLRYAFKQDGMVTVDMEMKHIRSYLLLQEARFDGRLEVDIFVDEDTHHMTIPKISIYTIVENSAEHGLENTANKMLIKINVSLREGRLIVSVSDNGPGIAESRLAELRKWLEEEQMLFENNESIGLRNLNARIKILYGKEATLSIESTEGVGAVTTMILPMAKGGDETSV
ncbi:MAG: hypothetical protein K0S71_2525 [Clostridia bacterium]|jgi:two-component system sensor histidine kinase YesM|nr:hypothetical protein [Clostridia bacterium]